MVFGFKLVADCHCTGMLTISGDLMGHIVLFVLTGTAKLGMSDVAIRVVLEADGTEIDEDEYLCFIENNATLIFLTPAEKWSPHIGNIVCSNVICIDNLYLHFMC